MKVINTEKKEMTSFTSRQESYYESREYCHICRKKFCSDENDKNYHKYRNLRDPDHYTGEFRGAAHSLCNLIYSATRKIPVVSHNGSNYDYHFIIKELAKNLNTQDFNCLRENMEKDITFKVPIKKVNDDGKLTTYKLKTTDSYRFMNESLSTLANNLSEINIGKCKNSKDQDIHTKRKYNVLICACKTCNNKS